MVKDRVVRRERSRAIELGGLLAVALLLILAWMPAGAAAGTAEEVAVLPTVDPLNRSENPLSNSGKWQPLAWDNSTSGHNTGYDTASGWGPWDAFSTINGAYWSPTSFKDTTGTAAAVTMVTAPGIGERYAALWIDMVNPGADKTGYQLRWEWVGTNTYNVQLGRYAGGTQTVIASNPSVSIPVGASLAIADTGGTVSGWISSGGGAFTSLLSATDSAYSSGYAGIQASGNFTRLTNFEAGALLGSAVTSSPVLDNLERSEYPLASPKWTKTAWAAEIGGAWNSGYRGYGSSGGLAGAYWNASTASDAQGGVLTAATVGTGAVPAGQYEALWLDMPAPGGERSGYEARFTGTGTATSYNVELSKWVAGTRTVLGSKTGFPVAVGQTLALTESGGSLAIWSGTSALTPVVSATDSTYSSGYSGLEVNGGAGTLYNFRAGSIVQPPDTTLGAGAKGNVVPDVSFAFSSNEAGASFECSLDGAAYAACSSPKAYEGLAEGAHTFRVRAKSWAGTDQTPAERAFNVLPAVKQVSKTPLLDSLERDEVPLATGKWTKTSWGSEIGGAWASGYHGYGSASGYLASAFWNPAVFNDTAGTNLTSATIGTGSPWSGEYAALWLDMPAPVSAKTGYEARFGGVDGSTANYKVELSRWAAGTRTVLATASGVSLPAGTTIALTGTSGGSLAIWKGTSTLSRVLAASDSNYSSGYAGLEVEGGSGTVYNFRAGNIDAVAPNTTILTGPTGSVLPSAVSFTFSATETGSTFECSLDGAAYSSCTSPKSYPTIGQGAHNFKVKATDPAGNTDATAAERSFTVIKPPTVATNAATAVAKVGATLNASVNPEGAATTYQFEYGPTASYGSVVPATAKAIGSGTTAVEASEPVLGLSAGTTYHFRISATNANGTSKGLDKTFTTTDAPALTYESPTNVSANGATLNATVSPKGAATTYQFEYGLTTAYGTKVPVPAKAIGSGNSGVSVSETIAGLTEGTTYHYRVVAQNSVGTTTGTDRTLTTPLLPDATTQSAEGVIANEAIVEGMVDPNGEETTYKYEYGTTASYGQTIMPAGEEVGDGTAPVEANAVLAHLAPETTYHYRVVAASDAGTDVGADQTLTTTASSLTPQQEEEAWQREVDTSVAVGDRVPVDFWGMMWTGNHALEATGPHMEVIRRSGAKLLREGGLGLDTQTEEIFEHAAKRGIKILPGLGGGPMPRNESEWGPRLKEFEDLVKKYGHNGSFWQAHPGIPQLPPTYWEVWNEQNVERNGVETADPAHPEVNAGIYGNFLAKAASTIRKVDSEAKILLGGLLSVAPRSGTDPEDHRTVLGFLNAMGGHAGAYDALSLHPYVFKAFKHKINNTPNDIEEVARRVREITKEVRTWLDNHSGPNKHIWITELGWPVENPAAETAAGGDTHPAVLQSTQRALIETVFKRIANKAEEWKIDNIFYYNVQDWCHPVECPGGGIHQTWDYRSGLRGPPENPKYRPGWYGFLDVAEKPAWPVKAPTKSKGGDATSSNVNLLAGVDPKGSPTEVWFKYGPTTSYGSTTARVGAGFEEGEVDRLIGASSLQPNQVYHARAFSINDNGEQDEGGDITFKTEPITDLTGSLGQVLNGEPGWVGVAGWLKHDRVGMNGVHVNVNFLKENPANGQFEYTDNTQQPQVVNGQYSVANVRLGRGNWKWKVVFNGPEQGYPASWSSDTGEHPSFTIKNAYQLVARHSGRCLTVEGGTGNGASVVQSDCTSPQTTLKQDFTLVPDGAGNYEFVARHSNRCLDVVNAGQLAGTPLQQWDCLGFGQTNQVWQGVPVETLPDGNVWAAYKAKHSGQCMTVVNAGVGNGVPISQNNCAGPAGYQQWKFLSVEANQVPVDASITVDEVLDGHPGYVTFHGNVTSGAYNMDPYWVNVNFQREVSPGNWQTVTEESKAFDLPPSGYLQYSYWGVGNGNWRTRIVFDGSGPLAYKESDYRYFTVRDGYRLKFRHSDRCLTTNENRTGNGTALIQWDCSGGSPYDGQTYSFRPVGTPGSNYFQLVPVTASGDANPYSGMCVDVSGASQTQGTYLQLWQCLGPNQWNQIWHVVPIAGQPPWFAAIAVHSNQCMDVANVSVNNGARFQQWGCTWGGNQQWKWIPVG